MTLESQSSRVTYHYQRQIVFRPNDRVSLAKRNDKQYDLTLPTGAILIYSEIVTQLS